MNQEIEAAIEEGIHFGQPKDSNGNVKPHFFSIIADPSSQLHRLRLPPKFSREHGSSLLAHAFLRAPEGQEHKVDLTTERDGHIWFTHGWHDFATTYSLDFGSFLVFRYEGNSHFHVFIFDTSCSEINYESFAIDKDPEEDDESDNDDNEEDEHDESDDDDTYSNQGISGAAERANAFRSDNPYFLAYMRKSYLIPGDYHLWVPAGHAKLYLLGATNNELLLKLAEERVVGNNDKSWLVKFSSAAPRRGRVTAVSITVGWRHFVLDNHLRVGDVCVFELTNRSSMTYRVHIYRKQVAA